MVRACAVQKQTSAIVTLKSSGLSSPKDLDGKVHPSCLVGSLVHSVEVNACTGLICVICMDAKLPIARTFLPHSHIHKWEVDYANIRRWYSS